MLFMTLLGVANGWLQGKVAKSDGGGYTGVQAGQVSKSDGAAIFWTMSCCQIKTHTRAYTDGSLAVGGA